MPKTTQPTVKELMSNGSPSTCEESINEEGKTLPTLLTVGDHSIESETVQKALSLLSVLRNAKERSVSKAGSAMISDLDKANELLSGSEIRAKDFKWVTDFAENNANEFDVIKKSFLGEDELSVIMELGDLAVKIIKTIEELAEVNEETEATVEKIDRLMSEIENTEEEEEEEEGIYEDMIKISGEQLKTLAKKSHISKISGYILGVTDKKLEVKKRQELTLNDIGGIRPPLSVIKKDTVIYIDEIRFVNEVTGRIFDETDLETVLLLS